MQIHSVRHVRRKRDGSAYSRRGGAGREGHAHRVHLETHGRRLQLQLDQVSHLLPPNRGVDAWFADEAADAANVSYTPTPTVRRLTNQEARLCFMSQWDFVLWFYGLLVRGIVVNEE